MPMDEDHALAVLLNRFGRTDDSDSDPPRSVSPSGRDADRAGEVHPHMRRDAAEVANTPLLTAAIVAVIDLVTEAKGDDQLGVLEQHVQEDMFALVSGPVVRSVVNQGMTGVCGAASVAGALNACREHISRERVGWSDILYDVYRDLFGLRVFRLSRREGRLVATSRYVSNRHVVRAIRSFPNMSAEVLVDSALAAQPREAWAALLAAMRRPHSAVLFHTLGRYVLVQGIVGGAEFGPSCALFICSSGHGAPEFVSFAEALATMRRCRSGSYKMYRVAFVPDRSSMLLGREVAMPAVALAGAPSGVAHWEPEREAVDSVARWQPQDVAAYGEAELSPTAAEDRAAQLEQLECAVCLDVLCEPVRLPCSHRFCRECMTNGGQLTCPLCRASFPEGFLGSAPNDAVSESALARCLGAVAYAERTADARQRALRTLRLRYGNRHRLVQNPVRSKSGRHLNQHEWTAFVELAEVSRHGRDIAQLVRSVRFVLAPYYTRWPSHDMRSIRVGRDPEVRSPPFEVTRVGWGYFPVTIVVTFAPELCLEPLELEHELCFNNEGSNFVHTLDLGALAAGVSPLQQRGG